MNSLELPFPWEEISGAATEDMADTLARIGATPAPESQQPISQDAILEQLAGCPLTYGDMTDADVIRDNMMTTPRSVRSYYVMGHRWVRVRNMETDLEVLLRLQSRMPESREIYISSIIVPFDQGHEISGNDLRDIPVAAIATAYSRHEVQNIIALNRAFALGTSEQTDPMSPLPKASGSDRFLALVGRQYDAIEQANPGRNIAKLLAEHNNTKLPNAQRWIAAARKRGFLAPAAKGQRPNKRDNHQGEQSDK